MHDTRQNTRLFGYPNLTIWNSHPTQPDPNPTFYYPIYSIPDFLLVYDRNRFGFGFRPNFGHFGRISVLPKLQNPFQFRFRYRPKQKNYFGFGCLANSAQIVSPKATLRALVNYYPQNLFVSMCGAIFGALGDND